MLVAASAAATLISWCNPSWAQSYPVRPVHIVIGFGVGAPDTTARLLAAQLTAQTGKRFLVDNKPGSSGVIGAEFVAKSPPDGYTLLVAPASLASLPSLQKTHCLSMCSRASCQFRRSRRRKHPSSSSRHPCR